MTGGETAATETVIRVEGLRMRYGSNDVLNDVAFTVRRGEVVMGQMSRTRDVENGAPAPTSC